MNCAERGIKEPDINTICTIIALCGVSADWLLGTEDSKSAQPAETTPSLTAGANCNTCKYKRLAEALKAVQAD